MHINEWPINQSVSLIIKKIGIFLELYNGAINAVATITIAGFTIVLARVTGKQARLTKQALIITERAFVFLEDFDLDWSQQGSNETMSMSRFIFTPRWKKQRSNPRKKHDLAS